MNIIVSKQWLLARLYETDLAIVDCRFYLNQPELGRLEYDEKRIPGAIHFDLDRDLSGIVGRHGGRHPLPNREDFASKLAAVGIHSQMRVVIYDNQSGAMASRMWFLMKLIGHEQVYILKESFNDWLDSNYPIEQTTPSIRIPTTYQVGASLVQIAAMNEIKSHLNNPEITLIDSREEKRFLGLEEPIDRIAGHIPGAIHYFWREGQDEGGNWKSSEAQAERFATHLKDEAIIVYCGSGVTACPNVVALMMAGFTNVKLYPGSWSDWISYDDNPISTK
jgi:thiosulfate/3-mercaptopyruvate sulfurtransferase